MTKTKRSRPRRRGGRRKVLPTAPARLRARRSRRAGGSSENFDARFEYVGKYYDDVLVTLEYDKRAVAAISALPQWAWSWDATSNVWRIHPGYAERLATNLRHLGYTVWTTTGSHIGAPPSPSERIPEQLTMLASCTQKA